MAAVQSEDDALGFQLARHPPFKLHSIFKKIQEFFRNLSRNPTLKDIIPLTAGIFFIKKLYTSSAVAFMYTYFMQKFEPDIELYVPLIHSNFQFCEMYSFEH